MKDSDLDLLATKVMGWKRRSAAWRPHEDIAQAFEIICRMREKPFSIRDQFIKALHNIIAEDCNSSKIILGLWNLFFLKPEHICLAALKAVEGE